MTTTAGHSFYIGPIVFFYIYLLLMLRGVKVIRFKVKEIYDFLIL
jgi:hypothetical protein